MVIVQVPSGIHEAHRLPTALIAYGSAACWYLTVHRYHTRIQAYKKES